MPWFFSWLPELPSLNVNLALPTSIQRRFLSFALKKSLGQFFRPGQLDARQIDSQIGSGFVQVNDLEFDTGAINSLISGLPLTLSSGKLSSATVRIPWPKPLTSTLGFSLNSLHLIFELSPAATAHLPDIDLASSVASVAETFLHEELTPREEASLMDSLHSDFGIVSNADKDVVPGGLDPFDIGDGTEPGREAEPGGISLFATLIERLLSRFEFDAQDIQVTLLHPGNVSVTWAVSEVKYSTNIKQPEASESPISGRTASVTRSLNVNGVTLQMKDLRVNFGPRLGSATVDRCSPASPAGPTRPDHFYQSGSSSSSSSLDEETTMAMSQSLATLPPRASSPPQSAASSMYQSALSVVNEEHESTHSEGTPSPPSPTPSGFNDIPQSPVVPKEVVFSSGPSPITLQMFTLPPVNYGGGDSSGQEDKITFSVQSGLFACALGPRHIGGLLRLTDAVIARLPQSAPQSLKQTSMTERSTDLAPFDVEGSLDIRGITFLLLPSRSNVAVDDLRDFFLRPLVPPNLPSGYLRLHIEGISSSLALLPRVEVNLKQSPRKIMRSGNHGPMKGTFSIHNISIFVFHPHDDEGVSAFPVLFTDPYLPSQYTSAHLHPNDLGGTLSTPLPDFDILDWTDHDHQKKGGARLSYWRCKARPRQHPRRYPQGHSTAASPPSQVEDLPNHIQNEHAFFLSFEKGQKRKRCDEFTAQGRVAPLHCFIDLDTVIGDDTVINFLREATQGVGFGGGRTEGMNHLDSADPDNTPPATPRARHYSDLEKERRRLEHVVLDDLDSEYGYEGEYTRDRSKVDKKQYPSKGEIQLSLNLAAVRLELRVPPPRNTPRSGALIIDLHDIELKNGPKKVENRPRFSSPVSASPWTSTPDSGKSILSIDCERILIAHSLVASSLATTFLSLGPLDDNGGPESPTYLLPLRPRGSVIKSQAGSSAVTVLDIQLPYAHVVVSKELLDGLQYFIDDASQLLERFSQRVADAEEGREGGDASLIGSHFFSRSRSNSGSALMSSGTPNNSETVVKVVISEAFLRAWVPRVDTGTSIRPFNVLASELNVLMELKPEGRDETIITLSVLDVKVLNVFKTGKSETLLSLTAPRSLTSAPRPLVKLHFMSLTAPDTTSKETKLKLTLCDFTWNVFPDLDWAKDLGLFVRSPPGTFESVIPSERTSISLRIMGGSIRAYAPTKPGAVVLYAGDMDLATDIVGNSSESTVTLGIQYLSLLAIDDINSLGGENVGWHDAKGAPYWKLFGYALVAEVADTSAVVTVTKTPPIQVELLIDGTQLHLHLAADTLPALSSLISDIASIFSSSKEEVPHFTREPAILSEMSSSRNLMASVEDIAFHSPPEIGPAPDMIHDDLPTNPDYLDESFGAAAGLREFSDDELDDLDGAESDDAETRNGVFAEVGPGGVSNTSGEIIKVHSEGINIIEEYYDNLPAELSASPLGVASKLKVHVRGGDAALLLYDGYDWSRTRKIIEEEAKEMRRRLAKIRQLVANGQVQELDMGETNAVLFNSVYIGIDQDIDVTEPGVLLAAIDEELKGDEETATQSSWQSLRPTGTTVTGGGKQKTRAMRVHGKKLTRSRGPSIEFKLMGCDADIDQFHPDEILVSKTSVTVRDVEILDHIKTSTWRKFLTSLRSDSRGNIRETDSNMVKIELRGVRPAPGHPSEEARLRAKILPLRLYVDQDAVDFLKKFFSFKDPHELPVETTKSSPEAYIQLAEIFPVDLKLDYKPRRVDYRALREGRTIELMNFFHFDGAEMTLRHITLAGVTGWTRLFEMLNDLWTPDVKATQLVDVISGVAPIRSMVNVGSGVADLVLLPISQYKKDGRIVRGIQKGATAFVKSTAVEAIKMGAHLATGTQVILEQAESVLGAQFTDSYTAEILQVPTFDDTGRPNLDSDEGESDLISKYAEQPTDIQEGFQSAYRSLRRNLNTAAQTILAVPMEIYERSGNEGAVRSVIRAVPIAVLKPMIGASEAVSKTLLGLHNTLDPNVRRENEAKYKHR